jgi:hypothetical protein
MNTNWKFFIDEKGRKTKCGLINGKELKRELTGVYFELSINPGGKLVIDIDEEHHFFYKKKLLNIYDELYELCVDLSKRKSFSFYSEITFKNSRLVYGVNSKIENKYY